MESTPVPSFEAHALSEDLVRRAQGGDVDAWDNLYQRNRDALLFTIRCRMGTALRGRLESEDVLQSVIKDALTDIRRFRSRGPGSLVRWLHACAIHKIQSKAARWNAQKRRGEVCADQSAIDQHAKQRAQPQYSKPERWERLEKAVSELPPLMREVVLLRNVEGLTNIEAAAVLKKSTEAVSKLHARALVKLGASLKSV